MVTKYLHQGPAEVTIRGSNLSYLQSLGSQFVCNLGPKMTWVWIFVKGGQTLHEGITFTTDYVSLRFMENICTDVINSILVKKMC